MISTRHALFAALLFVPACSLFVPAIKPLPKTAARDPELEREALRVVGASGINADPIYARVVSPFEIEQNELTGAPTKRYVEIVVVIRSRALENTCSWATHRFYQKHAGGGTYEGVLHNELVVDNGGIDCKSPELKEEPASAPAASPGPAAAKITASSDFASAPGPADPAETDREVEKLLAGLDPKTPPDCKRFAERSCRNEALPQGSKVAGCKGYVQMVQQLMTQAAEQAGPACKNMLGEATAPR
jgi:hypothetical protein